MEGEGNGGGGEGTAAANNNNNTDTDELLLQIATTNSDDYTEGSAWTSGDDQDSSSMYSSSEYGSPLHTSPGNSPSASSSAKSSPLAIAASPLTSPTKSHNEGVYEFKNSEEEEDEVDSILTPKLPMRMGGSGVEGSSTNDSNNEKKKTSPLLQMKRSSKKIRSEEKEGGAGSIASHFAAVAATDVATSAAADVDVVDTAAESSNSNDGLLDTTIDYDDLETAGEDDKAAAITIDKDEGYTNDGEKNNSILNPDPSIPRQKRRRNERKIIIFVVIIIVVSIVAAVVGTVVARGTGTGGGGGGGEIENKPTPSTSGAPTPMMTTSPPSINSGVLPPPTPPTNNATVSPTISPTTLIKSPTRSPSSTPTLSPIVQCYDVEIIVNYDKYPEDTSWTLARLPSNSIIESSPALDPNQSRVVYSCLNQGMYNFTIYDDYGDGMCCEWPNPQGGYGNYTLIYLGPRGGSEDNPTVIASGAKFNASESTTFSIPYV